MVADLPIRTIRAPRNGGFAYGCNLGTAAGAAEFVLLLNPDAGIESASLSTLVSALRADPALGGVGPRILGDGGELHWTQRRFPRLRSTYSQALGLHRVAPLASWTGEVIKDPAAYARPGTPDWLSGACVLLRRAALDDVGGLDEGFFLYSEETDLFRRLHGRGWRARFEPQATAYHQGYGSAPWETVSPILAHSRVHYARKHHGALVAPSGGDRRGDRRPRSCRRLGPPSSAPSRSSRSRAGRAERNPFLGPHAMKTSEALSDKRMDPELDARAEGKAVETYNLARASDALADLSRALAPVTADTFTPLENALSDWRKPRTITDLGPQFPALLRAAHAGLEGDVERNVFNRALVAHTASRLRFRLPELALPADVLERVPPALDRLHGFLGKQREDYGLGDDYFLKDVRFAAGWTVPCGAKVVDLRGRLSLPISLLTALRGRAPSLALRTLTRRRPPWFEHHTESRYLDEFSEAGMESTYLCVASLLRRHTEVAGLTAYGWLYDPQLAEISPRLSYLRQRPLERGAISVRGHTSDFDIKNSTAKSQTRKRLYEAGEYLPVAHRILWLRRDILRWADDT